MKAMKADRMDTATHDDWESECDDGESRCDDRGSGSDDRESECDDRECECDDRESELLSQLSCSYSLPVVVVALPVVTTQQYWRALETFHCRWELWLRSGTFPKNGLVACLAEVPEAAHIAGAADMSADVHINDGRCWQLTSAHAFFSPLYACYNLGDGCSNVPLQNWDNSNRSRYSRSALWLCFDPLQPWHKHQCNSCMSLDGGTSLG